MPNKHDDRGGRDIPASNPMPYNLLHHGRDYPGRMPEGGAPARTVPEEEAQHTLLALLSASAVRSPDFVFAANTNPEIRDGKHGLTLMWCAPLWTWEPFVVLELLPERSRWYVNLGEKHVGLYPGSHGPTGPKPEKPEIAAAQVAFVLSTTSRLDESLGCVVWGTRFPTVAEAEAAHKHLIATMPASEWVRHGDFVGAAPRVGESGKRVIQLVYIEMIAMRRYVCGE